MQEKINLSAAAIRWMERLCSIESPTGQEAKVLDAIQEILGEMGAERVELQEVEPGRVNVLATWGTPRVLLSSHFDTVPPYVPYRFDGESFHGRGTCDAKGQIVAQLLAIHARPAKNLAWLGVVDEEASSGGAKAAATHFSWLAKTVRLAINGEPTELKLATGQRGAARYKLSCEGISTHSGTPELGRNAIFSLIRWLEALDAEILPVDARLGKEIWNLGVFHGGTACNVVPAHAEAEIITRFLPNSPFEEKLEATRPPEGSWICQSKTMPCTFVTFPGFEETIVPFGSDAPHLQPLTRRGRVILCGPGTIKVAHTDEERLSLTDLLAGADLLGRLLDRECQN